eukprot:1145905-Pelagomonas_calceolata.AAC.3
MAMENGVCLWLAHNAHTRLCTTDSFDTLTTCGAWLGCRVREAPPPAPLTLANDQGLRLEQGMLNEEVLAAKWLCCLAMLQCIRPPTPPCRGHRWLFAHAHPQDVLFHPETYSICSKHYNLIAFNVELGLLLRVLRAAGANQAELLEVKLTQKAAPGAATSTPVESRPYLTFTGRDLPISKPYVPREIDRLVQSKEVPTLCPYYVDMQPCTVTLQAMVDKMRSISDTLACTKSEGALPAGLLLFSQEKKKVLAQSATYRRRAFSGRRQWQLFSVYKSRGNNGDVHINVAAVNMMLGLQAQALNVFPQHVVPVLANDRCVLHAPEVPLHQ